MHINYVVFKRRFRVALKGFWVMLHFIQENSDGLGNRCIGGSNPLFIPIFVF
jgi:hypothetical protein